MALAGTARVTVDGRRVVAMTPFGRRATVELLVPYIHRDHLAGIIDEWYLFQNTDPDQREDRAYGHELTQKHPWIALKHRPGSDPGDGARWPQMPVSWYQGPRQPKQLNTGRFYLHTQDRDTVYVRFDDDICYVHPRAVERLVHMALQSSILGAFPIIINNAVVSWHLQVRGLIPREFGVVGAPYCMDPVGWADGNFARQLHQQFLGDLEAEGDAGVEKYFMHVPIDLGGRHQFSVSCFGIRGDHYADLEGVLDWDEEENWLTMHRAGVVVRRGIHISNIIVPDAIVAHLTFYPHRDYIWNHTDIPARYAALAKKLEASLS